MANLEQQRDPEWTHLGRDDDQITQSDRDHEINRILQASDNDIFGDSGFVVSSSEQYKIAYREISLLVHPDKQANEDAKTRATQATMKLNSAMERARQTIPVAPEVESEQEINRRHRAFYNISTFRGCVRLLQIMPDSPGAQLGIQMTNTRIEEMNRSENWIPKLGCYPFNYFKQAYDIAASLRRKHREDPTSQEIIRDYQRHCSRIAKDCSESDFPQDWGLASHDPAIEPVRNEDVASAERTFQANLQATSNPQNSSNQPPADPQATSNYQNTFNQPPANPQATSNQHDPFNQPPADPQATSNQAANSEPMDLDQGLGALTIHGEAVLAKRKVSRTYQYLVLQHGGLHGPQHVWLPESVVGITNANAIDDVNKPSSDWVRDRKHKYMGIRWIALTVDGAITLGAGVWPPVTVCVIFSDGTPDTILWRSDAIKLTSQARIDEDIRAFLYKKFVYIEGRNVCIMSPTESGIIAGYQKAMNQILRQESKVGRSRLGLPSPPALNQLLPPPALQLLPPPALQNSALTDDGTQAQANASNQHNSQSGTGAPLQNPSQFGLHNLAQGHQALAPTQISQINPAPTAAQMAPSDMEQMMQRMMQQMIPTMRQMMQQQPNAVARPIPASNQPPRFTANQHQGPQAVSPQQNQGMLNQQSMFPGNPGGPYQPPHFTANQHQGPQAVSPQQNQGMPNQQSMFPGNQWDPNQPPQSTANQQQRLQVDPASQPQNQSMANPQQVFSGYQQPTQAVANRPSNQGNPVSMNQPYL